MLPHSICEGTVSQFSSKRFPWRSAGAVSDAEFEQLSVSDLVPLSAVSDQFLAGLWSLTAATLELLKSS